MYGRNSVLEVAIQCTTENPATTTFKPIGAVTTKSLSIEGNSQEVNDSSSSSGFTQNEISTSSLPISVSGNYVRDQTAYPNNVAISELFAYRFNSVKQDLSEQPVILVRLTRPDLTFTGYMIINSISIEDPDADLSTFTMELALAISPTYPPTLVATA